MPKPSLAPRIEDAPPELPDEAPYQMPLKMTVGDRRLLQEKARAANQSPTKWIVGKIKEPEKSHDGSNSLLIFVDKSIAFMLDKRRKERAVELSERLGYHEASDLAKDLLHRALDNPEAAEEFLFGPLGNPKPLEVKE